MGGDDVGSHPRRLPVDVVGALNSLELRDQYILCALFGLGGPARTPAELADAMDLSEAYIRRVRAESLAELRRYLGVDEG